MFWQKLELSPDRIYLMKFCGIPTFLSKQNVGNPKENFNENVQKKSSNGKNSSRFCVPFAAWPKSTHVIINLFKLQGALNISLSCGD